MPSQKINDNLSKKLKKYQIAELDLSIEKEKEIGKGAFGIVYRGQYKGEVVAIKCLLNANLSDTAKNFLNNEIASMSIGNRSPYILAFRGVCGTDIVSKYMPQGDLRRNLADKYLSLPWVSIRWQIALDIARGMEFLHEHDIIHRDLKSSNVLLTESFRAQVSDFDLSIINIESSSESNDEYVSKTSVGTLRWMAPELIVGPLPEYSKASDVYAYGVVLWEISTRLIPFSELQNDDILKAIVKGEYTKKLQAQLTSHSQIPEAIEKLMVKTWSKLPSKRPDARKLIKALETCGIFSIVQVKQKQKPISQDEDTFSMEFMPDLSAPFSLEEEAQKNDFEKQSKLDKQYRLFDATSINCSGYFKELLSKHKNVNTFLVDDDKNTLSLLGHAISNGELEVVKYLCERGANLIEKNQSFLFYLLLCSGERPQKQKAKYQIAQYALEKISALKLSEKELSILQADWGVCKIDLNESGQADALLMTLLNDKLTNFKMKTVCPSKGMN